MVDSSHSPDEPMPEEQTSEAVVVNDSTPEALDAGITEGRSPEENLAAEGPMDEEPMASGALNSDNANVPESDQLDGATVPTSPSNISTEFEQDELAETRYGTGLSLEEESGDEGPYDSAEAFIELSENNTVAVNPRPDLEEDSPDPVSDMDASSHSPEGNIPDATAAESEFDGAAEPMESIDAFEADPLLPSPENASTDAAEDDADWDLGDLETETDAADAVQLAARSQANGTSLIQRLQVLAQPALALWQRLLRGVRLRLPQIANLSDGILSGILIGILLLLLGLISNLGHRSPATATSAAPSNEINHSELPAELAPVAELEPAPLENNPDLERIADIQDQLTAVATSYASDLVASVQASFAEDRLSANLSSGWYALPRDQQDELAADLLGRSQGLEFATLELRDPDGVMVARSPVVGSTMVILQRQPLPEVPVPERPRYSITINR